jgi:hypothetical protein
MPRCAFLTIENTDGWFIDDDLAHQPLQQLGWVIENVPWTANIDWNKFDCVIVRSTWDYQADVASFLDVLHNIDSSSATLFNSLDTVRWNIDKTYLLHLQELGLPTVPTLWFEELTVEVIRNAFDQHSTDQLIVKPIVGANADHTFRISRASGPGELDRLISSFPNRKGMLQPFVDRVISEGEYSAIFFNGKFSHMILKTVKPGDYRVQEEHGGGVIGIPDPSSQILETARNIIDGIPFQTLYSRVDLVRMPDDSYSLMELELIEPALYFRFDSMAATRFAQAIDARFGSAAV